MDLVVYAVGSAVDNWHYEYMGEKFESHKELMTYLTKACSDDTERSERLKQADRLKDPEPWEKAKVALIKYVEELLEDHDDYQGYLSGKSNFRYHLATIQEYKANRKKDRPTHYDAIRQFLVETYDCFVSEGYEADDALGLAQTDDTIIVSIDKDLDVVPGWHYNWQRDNKYELSEVDSNRCFFKQMLTGDSTDNILGLYGVGPKSQLVKQLYTMDDVADMVVHVSEQYTKRFGAYAPVFWKENAQLLWILQSRRCPALLESDSMDYYKV